MKISFIIFLLLASAAGFSQIPKSGTYTYSYCDLEYNKCLGKCKIVIKGTKIWIYAPAGLTGIKEGEIFEQGKLVKYKGTKWTIVSSTLNKSEKKEDVPESWIDFKTKQYWTM